MFHYEGDFWSGLPVEVRQRNKLIVTNINLVVVVAFLCLLLFGNLFFSFEEHLLKLVFKKPYFSCVFLSFTFYVIYFGFCMFLIFFV